MSNKVLARLIGGGSAVGLVALTTMACLAGNFDELDINGTASLPGVVTDGRGLIVKVLFGFAVVGCIVILVMYVPKLFKWALHAWQSSRQGRR